MRRYAMIFAMAMLLIAGVCGSVLAQTGEELKVIHEGVSAALNAHDVDQLMTYFTEDIVWDYVVAGVPPFSGLEQVEGFFRTIFQAFPDWRVAHRRKLASDNILVTECTVTGTQEGEWMGIPATGATVAQSLHMDIYEFEGGKIKRATTYDDAVSLMIQLGVMPGSELPPLAPSFELPDPEPTGLAPLEAYAEQTARWNSADLSHWTKMIRPDADLLLAPLMIPLNRATYIASQELYTLGMSDRQQENIRVVDLGDGWLVIDIVFSGTNDGPYFGIPATGRPFEVRAGQVSRFDADGLLTYQHTYFDNLTLFAQLGLIPPPEPSTVSPASWGEIKAKFR